jgi:type IV pilus assembly protein PilN
MARINLLPWRETIRKQKQRQFGFLVAGAIITTLLAGVLVHLQVEGMIEYQQARNAFLKKEIKVLDGKIREIEALEKTKQRLLARMRVIQHLQQSRPLIVHLFDELVETIPEGVFLTDVTQKGNRVTIKGRAESNARVSAYMRNIEKSKWLGVPALHIVENKTKTGTGLSHFTLGVAQVDPYKKEVTKKKKKKSKAKRRGRR